MKTKHLLFFSSAYLLILFGSCSSEPFPEEGKEEEIIEMPDAWHDKIRETPYPKADNEIFINPAPLIVPQQMKKSDYIQFSLSRSPEFTGVETMLSDKSCWNIFNPHKVLDAGTWYWRFRSVAINGAEQPWSETYPFEVKEETPKFVTPPFATFFNNAPRTHPRLFCFLDGKIDQARQRVASHPEFKNLRSRAATALQNDYSVLPNPYDKAADLKNDIQFLYQAYYLTQQKVYSDKMLEVLRVLLAHPVSDAQLFASNFGSTDIAITFIETYDLLYSQLSADEKSAVEELLMRVARYYFKMYCGAQENHIFDNHFWQHNMRVLFQAAFVLFDKGNCSAEAIKMMEYYYELWTARAPASGFNRDGLWHNGASYFNANVKTLYYIPSLFSYVARKDFLQHPWYQNAGKSLVYTWPPQSKSVGFGDGSESGEEPNRQRIAFADFLARETGDTYAGWYATQCKESLLKDYELRLYRMVSDRDYATQLPSNSPKLIWYKDAGEVAIHSDLAHADKNLSLSFRSSTFGSGSHTVSNQNGFNLLYKGTDVYRSSGYYLNFSDAHNLMSYRHTRAHNTILVNGIGQPFSTKGYGNVLRAFGGESISYCLGDASNAYSGVSEDPMWIEAFAQAGITQTVENGFGVTPLTLYRRHVWMLHPHTVVIYDELEAKEPVRWDWLLHSPSQFQIDQERQAVTTTHDAKRFVSVAQLFSNQPFTLSQTDRFLVDPLPVADPKYPNQWHLTAAFEPCAQNRILTIIQVVPDAKQVRPVVRKENTFECGDWTIEANLDGSQPTELYIVNQANGATFRHGKNSSVLHDQIDGMYKVTEMTDYCPISTRVSF